MSAIPRRDAENERIGTDREIAFPLNHDEVFRWHHMRSRASAENGEFLAGSGCQSTRIYARQERHRILPEYHGQ